VIQASQNTLSGCAAVAPASDGEGDDIDRDLMDLDEAANTTGDGDEDEQNVKVEEEFGLQFDFGSKPLAKLLRLNLVERLKWFCGFPLSTGEMAQRIMTTLDTEKKGSLPVAALDFILKQIQGQLSLSKETFDLAEVCSASLCFSCQIASTLHQSVPVHAECVCAVACVCSLALPVHCAENQVRKTLRRGGIKAARH
jgi:hypothetical protein